MDGLNQFPGNGWERLPNRMLDPDFQDNNEAADESAAELKLDAYLEEHNI